MNIQTKDLEKSQIEVSVELSVEEFAPYIEKGAQKASEKVKIEGFRPGKVPLDILKQKIGEMTILEEAAHLAIHKLINKIMAEDLKDKQIIGQPQVEVTKLAPNNPFEFKVKLAVLPEIKLGAYKDLKIKAAKIEINDKEIDKSLVELAETRAKETISESPVKHGDKVIVNLEMFLDKVPTENGQAQDLTILIGKDYLVPGFDKKLLDAKKGQELSFSLLYPEKHHQANLAGKMVDFKIKIKEIYNREVAELNDEFAKTFGFKGFAEMRKFMEDNYAHRAKEQAQQKTEIEVLDKILEKSSFGDLPETLIRGEADLMISELEQSIAQQGGKMEDYLNSISKNREQLILDFLPQAVKRVKSALLLREITLKEDLKISSEEIEAKIKEIKEQYQNNAEVQKMVTEPGYRGYLGNILANQKVIKKLREWNVVE